MLWKQFVSAHYDKVRDLPAKERLKKLSEMYKKSKDSGTDDKKKSKKMKGSALVSGGMVSGGMTSGGMVSGGMVSGGDFKSSLKSTFKSFAKQGLELAKDQAKKQVEKFKEDPLSYVKNTFSMGKDIISKLRGSGLSEAKCKSIMNKVQKKHKKFDKLEGGAIPWNWTYLSPTEGISDQLKNAYIKGKVYMHDVGPARDASQLDGDENTFEWNQKYWLMKDEGQRLLNAVQVDNQRKADEPSAFERIATGLAGSVAEGVTKGAMGGALVSGGKLTKKQVEWLMKEYKKM